MQPPNTPDNEQERLASVLSLKILDTPAEDRYDRITRIARRLFCLPIALVSILGDSRQWFKSAQGLDSCETPRDISFCGHAILHDDILIVTNALEDERFHDNPLVIGEPYIRFYAGCPISSPDGFKIGTLCVIGWEPRNFSDEDCMLLHDLAKLVENEVSVCRVSDAQIKLLETLSQTRRDALIDPLTRLWNRKAITNLLAAELIRAAREHQPLAVVMGDLDHFKAVNDTFGHPAGDKVLQETASRIRRMARNYDELGRYGGEEFILVFPDCDSERALRICERIRSHIAEYPVRTTTAYIPVTISLGIAVFIPETPLSADEIVQFADNALYASKRDGRNKVTLAKSNPI